MSVAIASRYQGVCSLCEERFPEGTPIVKEAGGWRHDTCPEPVDDYDIRGGVCSSCFQTIAVNGACGCDD